jgi:hypothetical protein
MNEREGEWNWRASAQSFHNYVYLYKSYCKVMEKNIINFHSHTEINRTPGCREHREMYTDHSHATPPVEFLQRGFLRSSHDVQEVHVVLRGVLLSCG